MLKSYSINNNFAFEKCPLCDSTSIINKGIIRYAKPTFFSTSVVELALEPELWGCLECDSGFSKNIISEKDAIFLYQSGESNTRWVSNLFETYKTSEVVNAISSLLTPNTKVLDIGCAGGDFLDYAKRKQCITAGLEYSQSNIDLLRSKGHKAYMERQEINDKYDLITAFDVVEHLYDVNEFIDFCLDKLTPNGHIALVTGNISSTPAKIANNNWWYITYPEHIVFPSSKYFHTHPKLRKVQLLQTFANTQKGKKSSQVRGLIKTILTGRFSGSFLGKDHILIIAQSHIS
jgi:2-polyprenyl-3-methyl-5-hydroxy-6-metoxy-1,4-benzoquinol methylase